MTAKRSNPSRAKSGGRVTPKGTRPTTRAGASGTGSAPRFSVRHAQRNLAAGGRDTGDKRPTGARPAGRGQR